MQTFIELLRESVIFQGIITTIVLVGDVIIMVNGRELPEFMAALTTLIVGFYFGTKTEQRAQAIARSNTP